MANSNGSSATRVELYESLFVIAQATEQITHHLERLASAGLVSEIMSEQHALAAHQLRAQIAATAVNNLTAPELEDAGRYAKEHRELQQKLAGGEPEIKANKII